MRNTCNNAYSDARIGQDVFYAYIVYQWDLALSSSLCHVCALNNRMIATALSFSKTLALVLAQWRQQVADNPPLTGLDFGGYGHARSQTH
jgi:hypothetical protein